MPQTTLAILALLIVSLLVMNQQRNVAHLQTRMIRSDVATQSTGVAVDRLGEIGAMAFDERTVGGEKVVKPDSLTGQTHFTNDIPGNDIDDFNLSVVDTVRTTPKGILRFRIETRVSYASETDLETEVLNPTKFKKATVKVYNLDINAPDTVRLSQTYACGSRCTW